MARLDQPAVAQQPLPHLYDPATETDPLLQKYVTLPPPGGKNDAMLRGRSGGLYSVWGVILNYRIVGGNVERLLPSYDGDLTREHIAAALRFVELYPDEVLPFVERIERAE
jgi:hypothetical protein